MKQQITRNQLNELTKKQREKLDIWFNTNYFGKEIPGSIDSDGYSYGNYDIPLLSIGQMMEFIGEETGEFYVYMDWESKDAVVNTDKLCDNLWEDVKKLLKS